MCVHDLPIEHGDVPYLCWIPRGYLYLSKKLGQPGRSRWSRWSRLFLHLFEDSLIPDGFGHVHVLWEKPFKPHHPTIGSRPNCDLKIPQPSSTICCFLHEFCSRIWERLATPSFTESAWASQILHIHGCWSGYPPALTPRPSLFWLVVQ